MNQPWYGSPGRGFYHLVLVHAGGYRDSRINTLGRDIMRNIDERETHVSHRPEGHVA